MFTWPNTLIAVVGFLLVACVAFVLWARTGPGGDPFTGFLWIVIRLYTRIMHRRTFVGRRHVPGTNSTGGLVVVSNHTGPIDPLLLQAACRFEIRWMMAEALMFPALDWLWKRQRMIRVARDGRDTGPLREAIRHVKAGGAIGVFPEGAIVQPRCEVRPFHEGVGLIISRSRAPVLLVWVSGTPESPNMSVALKTRSRSKVVFLDHITFDKSVDAATITRTLRERISEASGWPVNDKPLVPPQRKAS